jgi:hypothetical protein
MMETVFILDPPLKLYNKDPGPAKSESRESLEMAVEDD